MTHFLAFLACCGLPLTVVDGPRLTAEPTSVVLIGCDGRQQLALTMTDETGGLSDVTRSARLTIEPPGVARIEPDGSLVPIVDGKATVLAEHIGQSVRIPVEVRNSTVSSPPSFRRDVMAVLSRAGCDAGGCHGNINGKGGFRLSLRNDDPAFDWLSITHDSQGRRVDPTDPARSLAVLKPTGQAVHEGGKRFAVDSTEARTLIGWVADGARDDGPDRGRISRLRVWPERRLLAAPGLSQQLVVTAEFADGTTRDVTRLATYEPSDPTRVTTTVNGLVTRTGPGEAVVSIRYLSGRGTSRLTFVADRPDFVWNGPEPRNSLDQAVFDQLRARKIRLSPVADDATFLRRVYLDAIGVLPTPVEARSFLNDPAPDKRGRLVDQLLDRDEFADFWALKWADLLRNEEKTMGEKGAWAFQRWLREQFLADRPLDAFARDLITSLGSTWQHPEASFHRTNRNPETAAEAFGQVFLGVRLQCVRCHNHPFDNWTQDDYFGLAATFANIARKTVNNVRKDRFDQHEINGDEIIYLKGKPQIKQPRTGALMSPRALGGPVLDAPGSPGALIGLADWLTLDNDQFTRNLANRIWAHLIGQGVVDPVDDFRESNPPSNPELLDALAQALRSGGMRPKPLARMILTSAIYERAARPDPTALDDDSQFAHAIVKPLPAEVLLDAIGQALDRPERYPRAPGGTRATQLAGVRTGGEFLKVFGKPERLLTCECERSEVTSLAQAFQLVNGESIRTRLAHDDNRIGKAIAAGENDAQILEDLYLATLSRFPTPDEAEPLLDHVRSSSSRRKAWEDVAWALLNSKEFLLRH